MEKTYLNTTGLTPTSIATPNQTIDWEFQQLLAEFEKYSEKIQNLTHYTGITLFIISLIGICSNTLNIAILSQIVKKSKLPVYRCFLGLAVADLLVMLLMSIENGVQYFQLSNVITDEEAMNEKSKSSAMLNFVFVLLPHILNIAYAASNWCVVSMSLLRFVAVFSPLQYQRHCTTAIVNTLIFLVYVFAIIMNIPTFLTIRYDKTRRFRTLHPEEVVKELGFSTGSLTLIVQVVVPMVITSVLLVPLLIKLCSSSPIQRSSSNAQYRGKDKLQSSITLVSISAFFVMCMLPDVIYYGQEHFGNPAPLWKDYKQAYGRIRFETAVRLLLAINYAANFFFYVMLNARLRKRLLLLLQCKRISRRGSQHYNTQQSSFSGVGLTERNPTSISRSRNGNGPYCGKTSQEMRSRLSRQRLSSSTVNRQFSTDVTDGNSNGNLIDSEEMKLDEISNSKHLLEGSSQNSGECLQLINNEENNNLICQNKLSSRQQNADSDSDAEVNVTTDTVNDLNKDDRGSLDFTN